MYLFAMYMSLKKCLFRSVHFFIRLLVLCFCLLFPVELYEFFLYFGCQLQIFPSIQQVIFSLVGGFLCHAQRFEFDVIPLVGFCFCCFQFWCQVKKFMPSSMSRSLPLIFSSIWKFYGFSSYFQFFNPF